MINRNSNYQPTAYDDDWEDIPASGPWPKWFGGIFVPAAFFAYGLHCILTKHGALPGRGGSLELYGTLPPALGLVHLSVAVFLHCHYFWGNIIHLSFWAVLGKIVSLIVFIGSLGYLIIRIGVFGH